MQDTANTVVCERHWPDGYATVMLRGKQRPRDPSTIFTTVPKSTIPTPVCKHRSTSRSTFDVQTKREDELDDFKKQDIVS